MTTAALPKRKKTVNAVRQKPHPEHRVVDTSGLWNRWVELSEKSREARLALERQAFPGAEEAWLNSVRDASEAWERIRESVA